MHEDVGSKCCGEPVTNRSPFAEYCKPPYRNDSADYFENERHHEHERAHKPQDQGHSVAPTPGR
jgi:hypothetical protein